MKNYDRMVSQNKEIFKEKVRRAKKAIQQAAESEEPIVVSELVHKTGLSRTFFYQNEEVKVFLDEARLGQRGKIFPQKKKMALDKAMERQLKIYERQVEKLKEENDELMKTIEKLDKALKKKELALIKGL